MQKKEKHCEKKSDSEVLKSVRVNNNLHSRQAALQATKGVATEYSAAATNCSESARWLLER
jgi:hypothetical protein